MEKKIGKTKKKCSCGDIKEEIPGCQAYPTIKSICGKCPECLFDKVAMRKTLSKRNDLVLKEFMLHALNMLANNTEIPSNQLKWFLGINKLARLYLKIEIENLLNYEITQDDESPEEVLERILLFRKAEDLGKQWSYEEFLSLKEKYEKIYALT